jgi:hypothetical protein
MIAWLWRAWSDAGIHFRTTDDFEQGTQALFVPQLAATVFYPALRL